MLSLIILLVIALIAAAFFVASHKFKTSTHRDAPAASLGTKIAAWFFVVLFVVVTALAFTTKVGTKEVGVVTSFGKITRCDLGAGLHFILPWQKVTQLDGTIQTDKFSGDEAIPVRINDGSTAEVSATIRWRIDPADACSLYQDYRSNDVDQNIADALVRTQFTASALSVFSSFDPLLQIEQVDTNPGSTNDSTGIDLDKFSQDLAAALDTHLAAASPTDRPEIEVVTVTISGLSLAQSTQDRLNQYQAEVAKTRIAAQAIQTAKNNAQANRELSQSLSHDPNVLVSKCLDIQEQIIQAGGTLTAAPSCWPGGNQSGIIVQPNTK